MSIYIVSSSIPCTHPKEEGWRRGRRVLIYSYIPLFLSYSPLNTIITVILTLPLTMYIYTFLLEPMTGIQPEPRLQQSPICMPHVPCFICSPCSPCSPCFPYISILLYAPSPMLQALYPTLCRVRQVCIYSTVGVPGASTVAWRVG